MKFERLLSFDGKVVNALASQAYTKCIVEKAKAQLAFKDIIKLRYRWWQKSVRNTLIDAHNCMDKQYTKDLFTLNQIKFTSTTSAVILTLDEILLLKKYNGE